MRRRTMPVEPGVMPQQLVSFRWGDWTTKDDPRTPRPDGWSAFEWVSVYFAWPRYLKACDQWRQEHGLTSFEFYTMCQKLRVAVDRGGTK